MKTTRKIILPLIVLAAAVILCFALAISAGAEEDLPIYGDTNGDGNADALDLTALAQYLANYDETTGTSSVSVTESADITKDGAISVVDLLVYEIYLSNSKGMTFAPNGDGTFDVTGIGTCTDTDLKIPSATPTGGLVTRIGDSAFTNCSSLTSITIPDSVTSIDNFAFYNCGSLTSIAFLNRVKHIGEYAFGYCDSLADVTIPHCVMNIGNCAFTHCTNLRVVSFEDRTQCMGIGDSVFENCDSLTYNVFNGGKYWGNSENPYVVLVKGTDTSEIHKDTRIIYSQAFYRCGSLTSITIPEGVTSIGSYAFYGCSSLTSVTIPDSVKWVDREIFYGCNLTYNYYEDGKYLGNSENPYMILVKGTATSGIHKDTKIIYDYAFYKCSSLTSAAIPENVTSIGRQAFYGCSSIMSITIPSGVVRIGDSAFYNCNQLLCVTIPDSVISIGSEAFRACSSLTSVSVGENLLSVGKDAFSGCYKLIEVINHPVGQYSGHEYVECYALNVHRGESEIDRQGDYLFYTYNGIHYLLGYVGTAPALTLPTDYLGEWYQIYQYAFYGSSATGITFVENCKCTSIGNYAFDSCKSLVYNDYNGGKYLGNSSNPYVVLISGTATSGIHKNTKIIYFCAFSRCNIESITIPDRVTSIGESAFSNCGKLKSVTIGSSVTNIGDYAFSGCSALTSVTMGSRVNGIGCRTFYNCSSLTSINIPDRVKFIGKEAFCRCSSLGSVTIPYSVESIGDSAFANCTSLRVTFQSGSYCTSIGEYAFYNCRNLGGITIPDRVTSIGTYAFGECISLIGVTLGKNVKSIGHYAFYHTDLFSITFKGTKAQWNAIEKEERISWTYNNGRTVVIECTDGDIIEK